MARILGLVGGGIFLALAVLIQESWRLSPPMDRRAASRREDRDRGRDQARTLPHRTTPGSSPVILTEMSTVNDDVILDDDLTPSDWVELYNRSDRTVSLAGWRLMEGGRPRRGWVFPEITLSPRTHLIVWASGKDRVSSAAGRRVNTRVMRQARVDLPVNDANPPVPPHWPVVQARRVQVDIFVPEAGEYTLWMKARAEGLGGTMRVRIQGWAPTMVTVPGGRPHHLVVGSEGGVRLPVAGIYSVDVIAQSGAVDVAHLAFVRAGPVDDRYARHVHAGFRLGRGREGVLLVDAAGAVRDEVPPLAHSPTSTLQREPESLAWRVGPPTPAGRTFSPGPDLSRYPSLSPGPLRIEPDRPPGVDELRYTLDGAVPTAEAPRLQGPLELTRPTALRLRGYSGGVPVTPIVTRQFWVGPSPSAPAVMLTLDPRLLSDPEVGILPNNPWRRQQMLPKEPALGPFRRTRSRIRASARRFWMKPAHLLVLDDAGVLFDGRIRVRKFGVPGEGLHLRTRDPVRPTRSLFGRDLTPSGRSLILDEDALNMPAYEVVRAAGGEAPRIAWGFVAVNGASPSWRVLVEPVDDDFLRARWGPTRYDLLKGKPFGVKRGTATAFYSLAHRLERSRWAASDLTSLVDLPGLIGLHLATLYIMSGGPSDQWQYYLAFDHGNSPPRLRTIGWDQDRGLTNWKSDWLGRQRELLAAVGFQSHFLAVLVVSRLLDTDPSFRDRYLREAARVLNHVLTPAWWEVRRQHPAWSTEPDRVERIAEFFRERPAFLSGVLAKDLGLPPPRVVRVDVVGGGQVTIDGYPYWSAYTGRYFAGATIEIAVPPEGRGDFRHFTANGRWEPGPVLRVPVTEDLEVVARFGD